MAHQGIFLRLELGLEHLIDAVGGLIAEPRPALNILPLNVVSLDFPLRGYDLLTARLEGIQEMLYFQLVRFRLKRLTVRHQLHSELLQVKQNPEKAVTGIRKELSLLRGTEFL